MQKAPSMQKARSRQRPGRGKETLPRGALARRLHRQPFVVVKSCKGVPDMRSAYYSSELSSWVRMDRQADGEYCNTSGYETEAEALGVKLYEAPRVPSWLES
jgi:hypothetical protein